MNDYSMPNGWMLRPTTLVLFAATFLAAVAGTFQVQAGEPIAASEPAPDAQTIRGWIADLESPSQATRGAAQASLLRAGEAALEPLIAAARSPNPEVRLRCVDVLRRHATSDVTPLAQSGRAALDELARASETSVARAAESALAAISRERAADEAVMMRDRIMVRGGAMIRLRPLVVPKVIEAMPAGVRSVSVSVVNGKRSIHARSGEETVEISDGGDDGITMTITKKVDGKEKKESFAAKDVDELKKKHAEAFKLYERYAQDGGGRAVADEVRLRREKLEKAISPEAPKASKAKGAKPKEPPLNHVDVPDAAPKNR
jgi:hypothetical protein